MWRYCGEWMHYIVECINSVVLAFGCWVRPHLRRRVIGLRPPTEMVLIRVLWKLV